MARANWALLGLLVLIVVARARGAKVSYDGRSLMIDGERKLLFSGSIHYPRSTPDMWASLIAKAKGGGVDAIETYVFWNLHEPQPGQYDFSGRRDIIRFVKEIQAQGLYAVIRIGPFIESEWNYGGLPFWLHDVPDIIYRCDNEPFKFYMQNFTTKIVNMFKSENLYAPQGGPIILSQIENEYHNVEAAFREKGPPYVLWAASMAVGLQTGVPWMMCKQDDAPDPVINTCNGLKCGETFAGPNSPDKPALWTENWTSFYQVYGTKKPLRSAQDLAFNVALFIAKKNGSFVNYYMYHGGTNFGRTASAFVITAYYDEAPLDEYGLIREPKHTHLKELHAVIKSCSQTILTGAQTVSYLGGQQEAYVFQKKSGECAAFLINNNKRQTVEVQFQNSTYELPPTSISILPDCTKVAFNTAKVSTTFNNRSTLPAIKFNSADRWSEFKEVIPVFKDTSLRSDSLLEHMNVTKDNSDYLWYILSVNSSEAQASLSVNSLGHALHAFVNGEPAGSANGRYKNVSFSLESNVSLVQGINNISLLSLTVGLPYMKNVHQFMETKIAQHVDETANYYASPHHFKHILHGKDMFSVELESLEGIKFTHLHIASNTSFMGKDMFSVEFRDSGAYLERRAAGLNRVKMQSNNNIKDLTHAQWGYQVGLHGEKLQLYTQDDSCDAQWRTLDDFPQPLTWYKTQFDAPDSDGPFAINLGSMGKGEVWINGESIGRYWVSLLIDDGSPSQTWYHIPRSFLKPKGNNLVLFEEESRSPLGISIDTISTHKVCARISDMLEADPSTAESKTRSREHMKYHNPQPRVNLHCPSRKRISKIMFASQGSSLSDCGNHIITSCQFSNSTAFVEEACIGKRNCSISHLYKRFGGDPCPGIPKAILVDAECS